MTVARPDLSSGIDSLRSTTSDRKQLSIDATNIKIPFHLRQPQKSSMTILAKLIWERDWRMAEARLRSHFSLEVLEESDVPYYGLCGSIGLALHLACTMRPLPPAFFIEILVKAFPEACRVRQRVWGLLPLHLVSDLGLHHHDRRRDEATAESSTSSGLESSKSGDESPRLLLLSSGSSDWEQPIEVRSDALEDDHGSGWENHSRIVQYLIQQYPESIYARETSNGMLPLHIAASTARSENGIVSPTSSAVLEVLLRASPRTKELLDGYGDSPVQLAWREATFCCYKCGNSGSVPCLCKSRLSVQARYLHPLLREEIRSILHPLSPVCRANLGTSSSRLKNHILKDSALNGDDAFDELSHSRQEEQELSLSCAGREEPAATASANKNNELILVSHQLIYRSPPQTQESIAGKHPVLCIQLKLTELERPVGSKHPRRPPNPYYEMYVTDGQTVASRYQSYPIMRARQGTWDDASIELAPTHAQTNTSRKHTKKGWHQVLEDSAMTHKKDTTNWQIGIRVVHCKTKKGRGHAHVIGLCQTSYERLLLQQGNEEKIPILHGFQVMGWLEVKKLSVN